MNELRMTELIYELRIIFRPFFNQILILVFRYHFSIIRVQ